jgi:hypothetical protein
LFWPCLRGGRQILRASPNSVRSVQTEVHTARLLSSCSLPRRERKSTRILLPPRPPAVSNNFLVGARERRGIIPRNAYV